MTPKDKAIELVNKYLQIYDGRLQQAKQCALIAQTTLLQKLKDLNIEDSFEEQVKQEINNL
jgi:hypothetical protein